MQRGGSRLHSLSTRSEGRSPEAMLRPFTLKAHLSRSRRTGPAQRSRAPCPAQALRVAASSTIQASPHSTPHKDRACCLGARTVAPASHAGLLPECPPHTVQPAAPCLPVAVRTCAEGSADHKMSLQAADDRRVGCPAGPSWPMQKLDQRPQPEVGSVFAN